MVWITLLVVFVLVIVALLVSAQVVSVGASLYRAASGGVAIVFILLTLLMGITNIGSGHIGVESGFSGVVEGSLLPGTHFVFPTNSVRDANVQTQKSYFRNLTAFSYESQDIFGIVQVNYHLDQAAVIPLYKSVGSDWYDKFVPGAVTQDFKEETVKYYTVQIAPHRPKIARDLLADLRRDLEPHSIHVDNLYVWNIGYSPQFTQAIESKQVASQRVQQATFEANRAVAVAKGQRDAQIARANGDATSIILRANAQAAANRTLTKSLTPQVIRYLAIQKLNPNARVMVVPNGSNILNLGNLGQ